MGPSHLGWHARLPEAAGSCIGVTLRFKGADSIHGHRPRHAMAQPCQPVHACYMPARDASNHKATILRLCISPWSHRGHGPFREAPSRLCQHLADVTSGRLDHIPSRLIPSYKDVLYMCKKVLFSSRCFTYLGDTVARIQHVVMTS